MSCFVVALAAAALPAVAVAAPDGDQGFGFNAQSLVRSTQAGRPPVFAPDQWPAFLGLMTHDGVRMARADGLWGPAEPDAPSGGTHRYDWSTADGIAAGFAAQGVRWDAVLTGSPKWAGITGSGFASPKPEHYADYAAFAGAFAARYGAGGSFWAAHPELPALPVRRFEIWNEPNTQVHWGTTPDPAAYAALFSGAQAAVKAVDPAALVTVGGVVWNDDVAFLTGFFGALGPGVAVDGLGSHPYAPTVFSLAANVVRVRKALDDLGRASVPLEINELGWPAAYDRAPSDHAVDGPVSDASRAATMALSIDSLARSTCDVSDLVVYSLVEAENDPAHIESLMGLYRRDGSTTLTSAAFADSIARYRAEAGTSRPGALPVPVCGARGAARTQVLPLQLGGALDAAGCVTTTVRYRGNPLEEAQVHLLSPGYGTRASDAAGHASLCRPASASPKTPMRISADIPGVARANDILCGTKGCRAIGPAAACAAQSATLVGSRRLRVVAGRGLRLDTRACDPEIGGAVALKVSLSVSRTTARRAGLSTRRSVVTVGRGSGRLLPGGRLRVAARFTKSALRGLRRTRRVAVTVSVRATEGGTVDLVTRKVTLRR